MGEAQGNLFEPDFNRSIKVQTTNQRLTSNAGVILLREAEHKLCLIDSIARNIFDPRDQEAVRYPLTWTYEQPSPLLTTFHARRCLAHPASAAIGRTSRSVSCGRPFTTGGENRIAS